MAKIMPEARLHECAGRRVERLAGGAQNFVNDRWRGSVAPGAGFRVKRFALEAFLPALRALAGRAGISAAGAFSLERAANFCGGYRSDE
jgi:hypothetical protein